MGTESKGSAPAALSPHSVQNLPHGRDVTKGELLGLQLVMHTLGFCLWLKVNSSVKNAEPVRAAHTFNPVIQLGRGRGRESD